MTMKTLSIRPLLALAALAASVSFHPAQAQDVGVSIGINQPGFYGRIDIGNTAPPAAHAVLRRSMPAQISAYTASHGLPTCWCR